VKRAKNVTSAIKDNQRTNFASRQNLFVPAVKVSKALIFLGTPANELFLPAFPDYVSSGR